MTEKKPEPTIVMVDLRPGTGAITMGGQVAYADEQKPVSMQKHYETVILRIIREQLGLDPVALPKHQDGIPGVKAAVRERLPQEFTRDIFRTTWKELRRRGELVETE